MTLIRVALEMTALLLLLGAAAAQERSQFLYYDLPPESSFLKVDQFGYLPGSPYKVAVISNPQSGFNAFDSFTPSETYEIREWASSQVVFSGPVQQWQEGRTAELSGDAGWWFDFSSLVQSGTFYVYDPVHKVRSFEFEISPYVYDPILRAAGRMFYYQRSGIPKLEPYAEPAWTYPGAAFAAQESQARLYTAPEDATTTKNLTGGWFDAGDFNKYVTFADTAVHNLLWAYRENPLVFQIQEWNIPPPERSTTPVDLPDVLKELQWELDWLLRMNNPEDGSTILKMGSISYDDNSQTPPDLNIDPVYFSGTCTSASIAVAGMFAHASVVFQQFDATYAQLLRDRAELAWGHVLPALQRNELQTECDDGTIKSGDADWTVQLQRERAVTSAIYLLEATGNATYNNYIVANIASDGGLPVTDGYWDYYNMEINDALLLYTTRPDAVPETTNLIKSSIQLAVANNWNDFYGFNASNDLYRGSLHEYYWGGNQQVASMGTLNLLMIKYGIVEATGKDERAFEAKALEMLHYLHGVNPLALVYLTNMYALGGDYCVNELYHGWFFDGTKFDSVLDPNNVGPPPGYMTGGSNQAFSGSFLPTRGQPPQKTYFDFNTGYPEKSWELTEPAIYYQSAYVRLLANFASTATSGTTTCLAAGTSCLRGVQDGNCNCLPTEECPPSGTSCNDGDDDTANDVEDGACNCRGQIIDHERCALISNGSFDDGVHGWRFWGCLANSVDGEALLYDITPTESQNPWDAGFGFYGLTVVTGTAYKLTFDASSAENRTIEIKVGLPSPPFTLFLSESIDLTPRMKSFSFAFILSEPTKINVGVDFFLGSGGSSPVFIDNVVFEAADCGIADEQPMDSCSVLGGTNFGNRRLLDEWSFWGCSAELIDNAAHLTNVVAGEPWDAGFARNDLTLHQGVSYTLTFTASTTSDRNIDVKVGLPIDPFTSYLYETVQLGTAPRTYTLTFPMTGASTTIIGLHFLLGSDSSDVILHNTALHGCKWESAPAPTSPFEQDGSLGIPTDIPFSFEPPSSSCAGVRPSRCAYMLLLLSLGTIASFIHM
jgi:endoglucanase